MLRRLITISLFILLAVGIRPLMAQDSVTEAPQKAARISAADQRKFDYFFYEGLNLKTAGKFDAS